MSDEKGSGPESEPQPNPMDHPEEQPVGSGESPRFGRLLFVLAIAVLLVVLVTLASEAYFSR